MVGHAIYKDRMSRTMISSMTQWQKCSFASGSIRSGTKQTLSWIEPQTSGRADRGRIVRGLASRTGQSYKSIESPFEIPSWLADLACTQDLPSTAARRLVTSFSSSLICLTLRRGGRSEHVRGTERRGLLQDRRTSSDLVVICVFAVPFSSLVEDLRPCLIWTRLVRGLFYVK
jgi:hypothetical protein